MRAKRTHLGDSRIEWKKNMLIYSDILDPIDFITDYINVIKSYVAW